MSRVLLDIFPTASREVLDEFPIGRSLVMQDTACQVTVAGHYKGRVLLAFEDEITPHLSFTSLDAGALRRLATDPTTSSNSA